MRIAFYMNCISAHQLPLARAVAELVGMDNFCYVDAGLVGRSYQTCSNLKIDVYSLRQSDEGAAKWLDESDVMLTGMRDLALFERRLKRGLKTYYASERWFKPLEFKVQGLRFKVPGWARLLAPGYRRMVKRFVKWANEDLGARVLAIGPWAKKDFLRMGVRAEKIVDWGYFVEKGTGNGERGTGSGLKVLWCGRMLDWKRVGDIVRAVRKVKGEGEQRNVSLTIVGDGAEKEKLIRLAQRLFPGDVAINQSTNLKPTNQTIAFLPGQPMEKVRELMKGHDLYVLASNAYEGWGAVVSEALEEGMRVLGTFEAGASATILPRERLFHAGDWKELAQLIEKDMRGELPSCSIGEWTAGKAARRLIGIVERLNSYDDIH